MNLFIKNARGYHVSRIIVFIVGVIFLALIVASVIENTFTSLDEADKVKVLVASLDKNAPSIKSWLEKNRTLGRVFISEDGRVCTPEETICQLPPTEDVNWDIEVGTHELTLYFNWTKKSGCRPEICDGYWSIFFEEKAITTEIYKVPIEPDNNNDPFYNPPENEDEDDYGEVEYFTTGGEEVLVWRAFVSVEVGGSLDPLGLNRSE